MASDDERCQILLSQLKTVYRFCALLLAARESSSR